MAEDTKEVIRGETNEDEEGDDLEGKSVKPSISQIFKRSSRAQMFGLHAVIRTQQS